MKKLYISLLITSGILASCGSNNEGKVSTDVVKNPVTADSNQNTSEGAAITFVKTAHSFGKITQGEKAEFSFKFTNTGNAQLLISEAVASCGCTVPEFSKEPINPGESGYIKVIFDSDKRLDQFEKSVTVKSNTNPSENILYISGVVVPKPEDQFRMTHTPQ